MTKEEIKTIKWLMEHPLWTHDWFVPIPPSSDAMFTENDNGTFSIADSSSWPIHNLGNGGFEESVNIRFVFVNPQTMMVDDNDKLNTRFQVWVEAGGWYDQSVEVPYGDFEWNDHNKWIGVHDFRLNCEADTVPEALLKLAELVKKHYNDDGSGKDEV